MHVPLVNEYDEIIGSKNRADLDYSKDIFRTASLWITNGKGEILLAQRKLDKKVDPGKWAEAVGGTVEGDDSYLETIIREAKEELGITDLGQTIGPKQFVDDSAKYFAQWYLATLDLPIETFIIQESEVEQIAWIQESDLIRELSDNPEKYIPSMKIIVDLLGGFAHT